MTARRLSSPLLLVLVASFFTPACYTLLKHPRVDTSADQETTDARCTSCHSEEEVWRFHHPPAQRSYPVEAQADWEAYYVFPWWYNSYWYFVPSDPGTPPLPGRDPRPGMEKRLDGPAGGPVVGPPPDPKSAGDSPRVIDPKDGGKGKKDDDKSDKKDDKNRTVRPKGNKEKDNDKNDG